MLCRLVLTVYNVQDFRRYVGFTIGNIAQRLQDAHLHQSLYVITGTVISNLKQALCLRDGDDRRSEQSIHQAQGQSRCASLRQSPAPFFAQVLEFSGTYCGILRLFGNTT